MIGTRIRGLLALTTMILPCIAPADQPLVLHDGTPVRLRLNRNLSSADATVGETADFEVLEDVKVGDTLVIPRGGTAIATVTAAQAKRRMARGGKIDINIDYVRLVNGDKVNLRAVKEAKGGGHTGAMTGAIVATSLLLWPAAPFFLFMHGKDITIPKGTEITAYVAGDVNLDQAPLLGSASAVPASTPSSTAKPMTNRDIVTLKQAGFSDDLIVAKVKGAPGNYGTDTDDIIALKKANLSEAVIQAMMAAPGSAAAAPAPAQARIVSTVATPAASSQSVLASVTVLSTPAGATIYVDGYFAGRTPAAVKLQPGTYKVTLKADGYPEYSQQVTVERGQVQSFGVALDRSK